MMNSVQIYIFRLCSQSFFASFNFLTFIFIVQQLQFFVKLVIEKNVPLLDTLELIFYMIPFISSLTLPIGVLFSVILVFSQLSSHSEIIAMRSCGFSQKNIFKPVIFFGILTMILTFFFMNFLMPETNLKFRKMLTKISQANPTINIQERNFQSIPGTRQQMSTLKIDHDTQEMQSVIIFNSRNSETNIIFSKNGKWTNPTKKNNNLTLNQGNIITLQNNNIKEIQNTVFNKAEYYLKIKDLVQKDLTRSLKEKSIFQINQDIKNRVSNKKNVPNTYYVTFHKRIAIPISCLIFVIVGGILGNTFQRAGKGESYGLAIFIVFLFYFFLQVGEVLGTKGYTTPFIGVWLSNSILFFSSIVVYFTKRI